MIYKKTHTNQKAFDDHLKKIKARGLAFRTKGMTIEYTPGQKSKDTSIKSTTEAELFVEASEKGYRKVKVIFKKINASEIPESLRKHPHFKAIIGKQKKEVFDVFDESSDIAWLLKNKKDVETMYFV